MKAVVSVVLDGLVSVCGLVDKIVCIPRGMNVAEDNGICVWHGGRLVAGFDIIVNRTLA